MLTYIINSSHAKQRTYFRFIPIGLIPVWSSRLPQDLVLSHRCPHWTGTIVSESPALWMSSGPAVLATIGRRPSALSAFDTYWYFGHQNCPLAIFVFLHAFVFCDFGSSIAWLWLKHSLALSNILRLISRVASPFESTNKEISCTSGYCPVT